MANYGKTDWSDDRRSNTSRIDYKEKFVKLTDGNKKVKTLLRIVSPLYKYKVHKVQFPGDNGNYAKFGRNVRCAGEDCPLCQEGNKSKEQYYFAAIVRKSNELKYVDAKWSLKSAILAIKDSPMFSDDDGDVSPTDCDIQIIADPAQGATGFYTALPAQKKPLSANDIQLIESVDFDAELEKMCMPPSAQEVKESIERIKKWILKNNSSGQQHQEVKEEVQTKEESSEVSDDEFTFRTVKR